MPTPDSTIEYFTDPPELSPERLVHCVLDGLCDPALARNVAAEIEAIQAGKVGPMTFEVDPMTACVICTHLHIALETAPAGGADRHLVQRFLDGLELSLAQCCPALGSVLLNARRRRQGGQR